MYDRYKQARRQSRRKQIGFTSRAAKAYKSWQGHGLNEVEKEDHSFNFKKQGYDGCRLSRLWI
jgi:hypothetical protein